MLARGALWWITLALVPALIASALFFPFGLMVFALPMFVVFFFRDPGRVPEREGVVSPADGRVSVLRQEDGKVRVGVFMNLHDVHVNRSPVSGSVKKVEHIEGAHRPAFTKESDKNERMITVIESNDGDFGVIQIAGAFARRITSYVSRGDELERGERIGVIAFGSRVDVVFPRHYSFEDIEVEEGDRVKAGETVVAPVVEGETE